MSQTVFLMKVHNMKQKKHKIWNKIMKNMMIQSIKLKIPRNLEYLITILEGVIQT